MDDLCIICFDDINSEEIIKKLSCGHKFHNKCISQWINIKNYCPYCRNVVAITGTRLEKQIIKRFTELSNSRRLYILKLINGQKYQHNGMVFDIDDIYEYVYRVMISTHHDLYEDYKKRIKEYKKHYFDVIPHRTRKSVDIYMDNTTYNVPYAQLSFFIWFLNKDGVGKMYDNYLSK